MIYSKRESLEDKIIKLLLKQPYTVKSLEAHFKKEGVVVTVQAIYKALRFLVKEEIVIKTGFSYSLNKEWQAKISRDFGETKNPLAIAEGETIRMDLTSLVHLDQQWKNILLPLHELYPHYPLFMYSPYDIWEHLSESRKKSESEYYVTLNKSRIHVFFAIGNPTIHDEETRKLRQSKYVQISHGKEYFKKTDYPVVLGDYIITTRLAVPITQKIAQCFQSIADKKEFELAIQKIGIEKKKAKLIIERNKEKARMLRKKMSSDFHVPMELRKKFDLF